MKASFFTSLVGCVMLLSAGCNGGNSNSDLSQKQDIQVQADSIATATDTATDTATVSDSATATDTATVSDSATATDFAPQSLKGKSIEFNEKNGPKNVWTFGDTEASLKDVGDFPYTYERKDGTHTVIVFDVDGKDRYEMTWTSTDGGTCTESFEGSTPAPCTFRVIR